MTYLTHHSALKTLQEAILFFADPKNCIDYMVAQRWPEGVECPYCGSQDVTFLSTRMLFQCKSKHPKRQFSVKVGTVFEDSAISLGKWLIALWMVMGCRNGISSYEVARIIGVTQKSAWFMLHRLREAMQDDMGKLSGVVEADETYMGGAIKNKHAKTRKQGFYKDKAPVIGVVERGGWVHARAVQTARATDVMSLIEANVEKTALVITDDFPIYDKLKAVGFDHHVINHQQSRYVRGSVHTNTIENFWSCLKRTIKGTYVAVSPRHLNAYVVEQAFRFNVRRGFTEQQRSFVLLHGVVGKRLMYKELIAR